MRITEHPYTWYLESDFPDKRKIRDFKDCSLWLTDPLRLTLLLLAPGDRRVAIFDYDSREELDRDVRKVLMLGDNGGSPDTGIGALHKPRPPSRSGAAAQPLPDEDNDA